MLGVVVLFVWVFGCWRVLGDTKGWFVLLGVERRVPVLVVKTICNVMHYIGNNVTQT